MKKTITKMKVFLWAVISTILLSNLAYAQNKQITGKITGASDSESIPGAVVKVKGTTVGTSTNIDGVYSISAKVGDVLLFSSLGYVTKEVTVRQSIKIDVALQSDSQSLSEVVVVGYGTMRKTDLSSAQVAISAADINKTVNTTIEQAIQGRASGVYVTQNSGQPGGGISVNIRGVNTINGSTEPLYVIDGVQIQPSTVSYGATSSTNALAGLNPSDIESINVLQGPSASAIYGSKATNGVVIVTTKRGKSGEMKVNYNYLYNLQDKPKALSTMTLSQYAQMTNEIRALAGGNAPAEFQDPSILGVGTNWQNALFKTAALNKHQLSLSGGNDKTLFYLSTEYHNQDGIALGSDFRRYGLRLNLDNETRKWLKLSSNFNLAQTNESLSTTQGDVINNAINLAPNIPVKNPDGSWGGADATNGNSEQYTPLNPVAISSLTQNDYIRRTGQGAFNADFRIIKGLTFRASANGNIGFNKMHNFTPTYRLGTKTNSTASLSDGNSTNTSYNLNQLLQYSAKISKHDFGIMASHESQQWTWENVSGSRLGFVTNEIPDLNIGSATGQTTSGGKSSGSMESWFGRVNYSFADKYILQASVRSDGSSNFGPNNRWGVFPAGSLAWRVSQEKFMRDLTFINEFKLRFETGITGNQGSDKFYGPLRSVTTPWGAGFILGKYGNESLKWEETKSVNFGFNLNILKNRIQLEGDYYNKNTSNLLMLNPLPDYMGTSGEGAITPPTVNIGALNNKGFGFTLTTVNMDSKIFSWKSNFNISKFTTKVTKFYSDAAVIDRTPWYTGSFTERSVIGQAPWQFFGYVQEGIFQSVEEINSSALPTQSDGTTPLPIRANGGVWVGDVKYKDVNGDGKIDFKDQTFIGNPWPKFTFGFTNSFTLKGFDLSILLTGSVGNDVYNYLRFQNTNPNNINLGRNLLAESFDYAKLTGDAANPTLSNPGTNVPRISGNDVNGNGGRFTQKFVEDGSYLRIKNISLGYNIPKLWLQKQKIVQGARLTVGIQNMATFTKYKGFDPEVGAYVGSNVQSGDQLVGVDSGRYPLTPVYTFNIGVDF
ncbi:MAG: TonB-dependent receptor [Sphingobacteriales bacterium]|nr:TonB-dependent receptor [Sphingobacteriales bacterium]